MGLLDLIKTALKKAGLKEDLADGLKDKIKSEEDIEDVIKDLKEKKKTDLTEEDFNKVVKEAGLAEIHEKIVKAAVDRVLQKAIQTHDEKLKAKTEEALKEAKDAEAKKKKEEEMTDAEKRYSMLEDKFTSLTDKFDQFLNKTSKDGLQEKVKAALKEAELDETFVSNIHVEKEDEIGDAVKELQEKVTTRQQSEIDKKLEELGVPKGGNGQTTTPTEEAVGAFAEEQEKGTSAGEFQGKDLGLGKTENLK